MKKIKPKNQDVLYRYSEWHIQEKQEFHADPRYDYMTCTEEAQRELRVKARPELKNYLESVEEYDNIFVVGPN